MNEFGESKVRFEELDRCTGDLKAVEAFMAKHKATESEWKMKLTQSQDVVPWVKRPETIDPSIKDNLAELAGVLKRENYANLSSILDVGCYGGYLYDYLRSLGIDLSYTGMDIRKDAVEGAEKLHSDCPKTRFMRGSVFDFKNTMKEKTYDVVVCSRVLIHLPDFKKAIANLRFAAKRFVFLIARIEEPQGSCRLMRKHDETTGETMTYFYRSVSEADIAAAAKACRIRSYEIVGNSKERAYCSVFLWRRK